MKLFQGLRSRAFLAIKWVAYQGKHHVLGEVEYINPLPIEPLSSFSLCDGLLVSQKVNRMAIGPYPLPALLVKIRLAPFVSLSLRLNKTDFKGSSYRTLPKNATGP
jgi:hypothetical protein